MKHTKKLKPTSPGTRHQIILRKNLLSKKSKILKSKRLFKTGGRSKTNGKTTCWNKGGGKRKLYQNFNYINKNPLFIVIAVIYDSNRTSFTSLVFNPFLKTLSYIKNTKKNIAGSLIENNSRFILNESGSVFPLSKIPAGFFINSVFVKKKIIYSKAAGTFSQVIQKTPAFSKIKLSSGKIILINSKNYATIGMVSNIHHNSIVLGKAGKNRCRGIKMTVRGVAMNPVDHPHGGKTHGGRAPVSPWGKLTNSGYKTKRK